MGSTRHRHGCECRRFLTYVSHFHLPSNRKYKHVCYQRGTKIQAQSSRQDSAQKSFWLLFLTFSKICCVAPSGISQLASQDVIRIKYNNVCPGNGSNFCVLFPTLCLQNSERSWMPRSMGAGDLAEVFCLRFNSE